MSAPLIPVIETERLRLRGPKVNDLAPLTAFFETEGSAFVGGPMSAGATQTAMLSTIGSWALYGYGLWHVAIRATDRFIGWVGLLPRADKPEPSFAGAIMTADQRQGYALEAGRAALSHLTGQMNRFAPVTYIDAKNVPSLRAASQLGFAQEAADEAEITLSYVGRAA